MKGKSKGNKGKLRKNNPIWRKMRKNMRKTPENKAN